MTRLELVTRFKEKYPQYKNQSDDEVIGMVLTKFPQYVSILDGQGPLSANPHPAFTPDTTVPSAMMGTLKQPINQGIIGNIFREWKLSSNASLISARADLLRRLGEIQTISIEARRREYEAAFAIYDMQCKKVVNDAIASNKVQASLAASQSGVPLESWGEYLIEKLRAEKEIEIERLKLEATKAVTPEAEVQRLRLVTEQEVQNLKDKREDERNFYRHETDAEMYKNKILRSADVGLNERKVRQRELDELVDEIARINEKIEATINKKDIAESTRTLTLGNLRKQLDVKQHEYERLLGRRPST
jgi:hypothetical protein